MIEKITTDRDLPETVKEALRARRILLAVLLIKKEYGLSFSQSVQLLARQGQKERPESSIVISDRKDRGTPLSSWILTVGFLIAVLWAGVMTMDRFLPIQTITSNAGQYHTAIFVIERSGIEASHVSRGGSSMFGSYGFDENGVVYFGHNAAPNHWFVVGSVEGRAETILSTFYHQDMPQSLYRLTQDDLNRTFPKGDSVRILINPSELNKAMRILDEDSPYLRDPDAAILRELKRTYLPAFYIFGAAWILAALFRRRQTS